MSLVDDMVAVYFSKRGRPQSLALQLRWRNKAVAVPVEVPLTNWTVEGPRVSATARFGPYVGAVSADSVEVSARGSVLDVIPLGDVTFPPGATFEQEVFFFFAADG